MSRLIELQQVTDCCGPLSIGVGDVLLIPASGCRVERGSSVELGGPYLSATATAAGEILTAAGSPNTVLVWARQRGPAVLEIITGDPWRETQTTRLHINVEE